MNQPQLPLPNIISFETQRDVTTSVGAAPFLKWAGGKRKLVDIILQAAPPHYQRYLEPFLGGGAVALSINAPILLLNDANTELIDAYKVVRDDLGALLRQLGRKDR